MRLFRRLILRPLRRDLTRTLLTLLSIALGVAVVIAIDLAGDAATGSFESSLLTLVGKVDYEITANGDVNEQPMGRLATLPVNARFAPVIQQPVVIEAVGATTLYGIDMAADGAAGATANEGAGRAVDAADSIVVSGELAARAHLKQNDSLVLRGRDRNETFRIAAIAPGQNSEWAAIDIAAAQQLLDYYGKLDRIEVFIGRGESASEVERLIRANIPAAWNVETPGARREENRRMLRAFRWNLRILSYISLLVGAFLIYNTIAVSVVRRRTEIGILRALGLSSRGVLLVFLGEALMLGLAGSAVGILLGRGLASGLVGMLSETVNALFTTSAPGEIGLTAASVAGALTAGAGVALVSALIPALDAARVAPAEAMRRALVEHERRLHWRRDLAIAAGAAALAGAFCAPGPIGGRPLFGYLATLFAVGAAAMIAPAFITGSIRGGRGLLRRFGGAAGLMAGKSLVASLARTSIVAAALATAIGMMVSVGVMVGSFRETVQVWLNNQLSADIYMRAQGPESAGVYPPIAAPVADIVRKTPGVAFLDVLSALEIDYEGQRTTLGGAAADVLGRKHAFRFLSGNGDRIMASLAGHDRAVVTQPFAEKHHVRPGDILRVPLGDRIMAVSVAGIYYDYSSDRGFILVDRDTLLKYLPGEAVTNVAVYVTPGADRMAVRRELERRLADYPLMIAPNEELRRGAVEVFDRTFAVTYALEAIAIVVAMLGAANSLLALVLDRRREIGLIRYLGAAQSQVRGMILTEAGLLGLIAGALGLALGLALSLILIYVINKQSFGWTIQFHPPVLLLGGALLSVWAVTVLAGVYPARFAARLKPAEAVQEE